MFTFQENVEESKTTLIQREKIHTYSSFVFMLLLSFWCNWIKCQRFPLRGYRRLRILFGELGDCNSTFTIIGGILNVEGRRC